MLSDTERQKLIAGIRPETFAAPDIERPLPYEAIKNAWWEMTRQAKSSIFFNFQNEPYLLSARGFDEGGVVFQVSISHYHPDKKSQFPEYFDETADQFFKEGQLVIFRLNVISLNTRQLVVQPEVLTREGVPDSYAKALDLLKEKFINESRRHLYRINERRMVVFITEDEVGEWQSLPPVEE